VKSRKVVGHSGVKRGVKNWAGPGAFDEEPSGRRWVRQRGVERREEEYRRGGNAVTYMRKGGREEG